MTISDKPSYKVVSLFSGAMGLDVGLEKTGRFEIIACIEKEPVFCKTIKANIASGNLPKQLLVIEDDICNIDPQDLLTKLGLQPGEIDLLVGGPPCQSFSTAGRRGTVQDVRGTLLWQFLRFVKILQPKFFLMENVRGLLSAALKHRPIAQRPDKNGRPLDPDEEPGSVVRLFAEDLQNLPGSSYHMDCFEVNAVNYGAPQLRERVLFIGNRFNATVDFPNPTHGIQSQKKSIASLIQASLWDATTHDELLPWKTLGDAIGHLEDPGDIIMDFSPRKKEFLSLVPPGSNWRSLPENLQKESMGQAWFAKGGRSGWWRRLSFDLPCPTLVTMPNHSSTALCHPSEVRALTLKEYALIQEFPGSWKFKGSPSQQYAQVGNAVPVRLGEVAGDVLVQALDMARTRNWPQYEKRENYFRIVYIQSHVRTRQWYKSGQTFIWDDGENNSKASYNAPVTLRKESRIGG